MQSYNSSGFTLLELMVAVAIVGILLGIGVPSFADAMRRNRVATVTNELTGALALARSEAVKRGMPITVCGGNEDQDACAESTTWDSGLLVFHDDSGVAGKMDDTDEFIQKWPSAESRKISLIAADSFLTFRPSGSVVLPVATTDFVVEVNPAGCKVDDAREITILRAGRSAVTKVPC